MSLRDQAKQLSYAENLANRRLQFSEKDRDYQTSGDMLRMVENLPVMWLVADWDSGVILHTNSELSERMGLSIEDLCKMKFEDLFEIFSKGLILGFQQRILSQTRISIQDAVLKGSSRILLPVNLDAQLIFDEQGHPTSFSVVFHPLPPSNIPREDEQLFRQLQRSNEDLEQFAYITSHDLQEPLRMITSYLQLLEKRAAYKLNETDLEFLNFAVDGAIRMKELLDGILEYSRISTRGKPFEVISMKEILDQVKQNLNKVIIESDTQITYDALPVIYGDQRQITRLIQNLVSNSIKFSGNRSPRIEITWSETKSHYQFHFRDYGIGISSEYLERIFLIFQRLNHRKDYPGNGIGLAICRGIVRRHGGRIWAESHGDEGTSFCFTIGKKNYGGI
ncbi:MAG: hypothetical protein KDE26_03125 [Bacteroidetes bacterium]|nr:hypothetical protein [Bacteroidota bacterium]MCB0842240.1 hypothetical protein [Bacteroidota bacterium]